MATLDRATTKLSRVDDWALFLVAIEGQTVVEEPNGKFSRVGVSMDTRQEAEEVTYQDFLDVVQSTNQLAYANFGLRLPVESFEYFLLRDLMWLAGPKVAIEGFEAYTDGTPVMEFAANYLLNLSKNSRFAQYRSGWIARLRRLMWAFYIDV